METDAMDVADSILDLVGNTPLVRLKRLSETAGLRCLLAAKLETTNPGGSVKDRPAVTMIDAAERDGLIAPGGTIIEATSGNTGIGLAIVAAQRGYRCVFVMTEKVAPEKVALLRAYGADVVICPLGVAPDDPRSYYSTAARLEKELPNAFRPNQYANPANPLAHYRTTGPELWRQTNGRITHFVAGMGTCGTIAGTARYLKEQNRLVKVIGADPEGSLFSGDRSRPYLVEGIGEDFFPAAYDPSLLDDVIRVSDEESFLTARRVSHEEGILIGGSGGTAVAAALRVAREADVGDVVVVLIPDSGRGYLSKVFDDDWMATYGFIKRAAESVADVLAGKGDAPRLLHIGPAQSGHDAIALMHRHGVSQLPVCVNEPPFSAAEVIGSVDELTLMDRACQEPGSLAAPVETLMSPKLPTIGIGEAVSRAVALLDATPALLVLSGGRPDAVITRGDVLGYLAKGAGYGRP